LKIKAVSFDIGHTLVRYNNPLNWKSLYEPALKQAFRNCALNPSNEQIQIAADILTKYNTRENPREFEVTSVLIFTEIFNCLELPLNLIDTAKTAFFSFFQSGAVCYDDVENTLRYLQSAGVYIGALTDVAYGMENSFSLQDIATIRHYFDAVFTSVDVGYRKPNAAGFLSLLNAFDVSPSQMLYVGDEQKDMAGANALGIVSVLIDRNNAAPDWKQSHTIHSLFDIQYII